MRKKRPIDKNYLREHRERIIPVMTIQDLADLLETNWQNIQRYETMERALTMSMANKIAPHIGLASGAMIFSPPGANVNVENAAYRPKSVAQEVNGFLNIYFNAMNALSPEAKIKAKEHVREDLEAKPEDPLLETRQSKKDL